MCRAVYHNPSQTELNPCETQADWNPINRLDLGMVVAPIPFRLPVPHQRNGMVPPGMGMGELTMVENLSNL